MAWTYAGCHAIDGEDICGSRSVGMSEGCGWEWVTQSMWHLTGKLHLQASERVSVRWWGWEVRSSSSSAGCQWRNNKSLRRKELIKYLRLSVEPGLWLRRGKKEMKSPRKWRWGRVLMASRSQSSQLYHLHEVSVLLWPIHVLLGLREECDNRGLWE